MKVSIVIPNWNGQDKLRKNLPAVLAVKGVDEVIISDDASTDESVEVIKKEFPQIVLVERKVNGGFSSNVNTGVKAATGDLIFLLNSDASPEKNCLESVLPHFSDPKVFSVGCNTGGSWTWATFRDGFFWHHEAKEKPATSHETLWASGGSSIFRKSTWDELGGLDELFDPFYEEDLDLGYRARKRGFINIWEPKAKVEHYKEPGVIKENFSEDTINKTAQRNQLFFIWKNITSPKFFSEHQQKLIGMLLSHPKYWQIFLAAFIHISEVSKKRKIEQKNSKVTDEEILNQYQTS